MRLCNVKLNYFPPYAGGGTRMASTLFRYLAREHEVHVVTHASPGYTEPEQILDGVRVHRTPTKGDSYSPLQGIRFFVDAWKLVRRLHDKHQFAVVHGYSAFSFMGLFTRAMRLQRAKKCFTLEAYPLNWRDWRHLRSFYHLSGLVPHSCWSGAMHRTYVVSRYSLDAMRSIGADERRLAVLPPAIDLHEYQPLQSREAWPNDFVYASSCTLWKGIEDIIEAMRLLRQTRPDFRVIMFCPNISRKLKWDHTRLGKMVQDYGLAENLKLISELCSEVGQVMAGSRAVIAPFRSMLGTVDIPLSLLEGMAVGVPVIGSTLGGIPEIVSHGENGLLVPPQAPPDLANAMLTLLGDDDLCRRMGERGREMVQDYAVDAVAATLLEDYARDSLELRAMSFRRRREHSDSSRPARSRSVKERE